MSLLYSKPLGGAEMMFLSTVTWSRLLTIFYDLDVYATYISHFVLFEGNYIKAHHIQGLWQPLHGISVSLWHWPGWTIRVGVGEWMNGWISAGSVDFPILHLSASIILLLSWSACASPGGIYIEILTGRHMETHANATLWVYRNESQEAWRIKYSSWCFSLAMLITADSVVLKVSSPPSSVSFIVGANEDALSHHKDYFSHWAVWSSQAVAIVMVYAFGLVEVDLALLLWSGFCASISWGSIWWYRSIWLCWACIMEQVWYKSPQST